MTPSEYTTESQVISFAEYSRNMLVTSPKGGADLERILNAALGLGGESGEVCDMLKKHLFQGHPLDHNELILELGDILWYVAYMAYALGVPLEEVAQRNVDKLRKRYPNGFSVEASVNRKD